MLTRLTQAWTMGAVPWPEGSRCALVDPGFAPEAASSVPELSPDRTDVITSSARQSAAWAQAGYATQADPQGPYDAALFCVGRVRVANKLRLAQVAAEVVPGGPVLVDGQKTDGVEPLLREVRARARVIDSFAKSHGRVFWFAAGDDAGDADAEDDDLEDGPAPSLAAWAHLGDDWPLASGFRTAPGVFSADGVDPGSRMLADALPDDLRGTGADLGAGWGYLAARCLERAGVTALDLVEDDARAIAAARANVTDTRARHHWADALTWRPTRPLDFVLTNPPFHSGRAADPSLGQAFIRAAAAMLTPQGTLWLVANRHLPYEAVLEQAFRNVHPGTAAQGYKVIAATGPRTLAEARRHP